MCAVYECVHGAGNIDVLTTHGEDLAATIEELECRITEQTTFVVEVGNRMIIQIVMLQYAIQTV